MMAHNGPRGYPTADVRLNQRHPDAQGGVMAKVYYVKDGSYPQNLVDPLGRRIALAELERRLQGRDVRYLSTLPPEFNPEQPSHEIKHVIVELATDEPLGQRLTRTGYYLVPQLSPDEAEALLFPPA
jgi:hypothetical protein